MILMEMMLEVAMGVMDMEDDKVADVVLMIPNEDFSDGTVVMEMMLEIMMWMLDMEVDKVMQCNLVAKILTNASGAT